MGNIFGRGGLLDDINKGAREINRASNSVFGAKRSVQRTALDVTTTPYQWHTGVNRAHATANRSEASVHNSQGAIYRAETNEQRAMDKRDEYMNNRNANQGHFGGGTPPTVGGIPANNNVPQALNVSAKDQARYNELTQIDDKIRAADLNHNGQVDPNEMTPDVKKLMKEADKLARKIGDDDLAKMNAYNAQNAANSNVQQGVQEDRDATVDFLKAIKTANTTTGAEHDAALKQAKDALQKLPHDDFGNVQLNQNFVDPLLKESVLSTGRKGTVPEIFKLTSDEALLNATQKAYEKAGVGKASEAAAPAGTAKTTTSAHPTKDFSDAMNAANHAKTDDARIGALGRAAIALEELQADQKKFNMKELDPSIQAEMKKNPAAAMALLNDPNALIKKASEALAAGTDGGKAVTAEDITKAIELQKSGKTDPKRLPLEDGVGGTGHTSEPTTPAVPASATYDKEKYGSKGTQEVANAQIQLEKLGFHTDVNGVADGKVDGVKGRITTAAIAKAEAVLKANGMLPEGHVTGQADAALTKALEDAQKKPEVLAALQAASDNKPEVAVVAEKTEVPLVTDKAEAPLVTEKTEAPLVADKTEAIEQAKLPPDQKVLFDTKIVHMSDEIHVDKDGRMYGGILGYHGQTQAEVDAANEKWKAKNAGQGGLPKATENVSVNDKEPLISVLAVNLGFGDDSAAPTITQMEEKMVERGGKNIVADGNLTKEEVQAYAKTDAAKKGDDFAALNTLLADSGFDLTKKTLNVTDINNGEALAQVTQNSKPLELETTGRG